MQVEYPVMPCLCLMVVVSCNCTLVTCETPPSAALLCQFLAGHVRRISRGLNVLFVGEDCSPEQRRYLLQSLPAVKQLPKALADAVAERTSKAAAEGWIASLDAQGYSAAIVAMQSVAAAAGNKRQSGDARDGEHRPLRMLGVRGEGSGAGHFQITMCMEVGTRGAVRVCVVLVVCMCAWMDVCACV